MLFGAFSSSMMNMVIRLISDGVHPFEIAFFRNAFAIVFMLPMVWNAGFASLQTRRLGLHALRGVLNALAMLAFFLGLTYTTLATAAALAFTAPLFATLLASLLLGEAVGTRRIVALVTGFSGALLILRPGLGPVGAGEIMILGASLGWGFVLTVIKRLSKTETSLTITVYAALFLTPICLIAAIPFWVWPSLEQLAFLGAIAAFGSIYQLCLAQALKLAEASQVMPGDFTKLVFSALLGWLAFNEIPDLFTWVGGTVIFASVFYVTYREAQMRKLAHGVATGPAPALAAERERAMLRASDKGDGDAR